MFFIFYTICNGFAVGCCVLVAQYWGRQDVNAIKTILAIALRAIAVFGLIVTVLVMLFPTFFMRIYSSDPALIELGAGYMRLVALMYTPCAISVMLFAGCRGVEQVRIILATNIVSYSVNIFLDVYKRQGQSAAHGIYDVPVVDTTAAGDTFTGYFLAGVTEGLPVERILELASKASSLAVSRKGASDSIPARAEVEACELVPLG